MHTNEPSKSPLILVLDEAGITNLAKELINRRSSPKQRGILAVAGVPGSGKSTLSQEIINRLNQAQPGTAVGLPMDAYHMTNDKLEALGLRKRKGAVQTFEAQQYFKHLSQVRDAARQLSLPTFDRGIDEPVFTGKAEHTVSDRTKYIITEGNYLLLDSLPWTAIDQLADLRVWIDIPAERARRQTIQRHIRFGRTPQEAKHWYETNDQLNADFIRDRSRHADLIVRWP
ncbi:MAG: nucleoside/nucleotide kinase family protein [Planctomycetota bacterium]